MKKIVSIILMATLIISLCTNGVNAAALKQTVDTAKKLDPMLEEIVKYEDAILGETYVIPFSTSKAVFQRIRLSDMAAALLSDPDAHNVQFSGNVLTYMLSDGTIAEIAETVDCTGTLTFDITEGDKSDSLTIDYSKNEAFLNGNPLTITKTEAYVYRDLDNVTGGNTISATKSDTTWIKIGNTTYYDAYVENQVRNATTSLIYTLISALVNPIAGLTIGICSIIIQFYISLQSSSKYFYISRALYYDNDLPDYHYLEVTHYYSNSNYTGLITFSERDILV